MERNGVEDIGVQKQFPGGTGAITRSRRIGVLILFLVSSSIAGGIGRFILHEKPGGVDYRVIHAALRAILEHKDPYLINVLNAEWLKDGGELPNDPKTGKLENISQFAYPPTIAVLAPFAAFSFQTSHLLWIATLVGVLSLAALLIWQTCAGVAPDLSFVLLALSLGTGPVFFYSANPAGLAIGLCVIGCWCLIEDHSPWAGVMCLATGLIIKPHDVLLVWVCLLLAGGMLRRRALQVALMAALLAVPGLWRMSTISQDWPAELRSNLATLAARGEIDDPRPDAYSDYTAGMMLSLQAGVSLFDGDSRIYNGVTYLICGTLFLLLGREVLRDKCAAGHIWYLLAAAAPLTMLMTYHRSYDAKLLVLCLPAGLRLWSNRDGRGWTAAILLVAAIALVNEIGISSLQLITNGLPVHQSGIGPDTPLVVAAHPIPFLLLAMSVFYLWTYAGVARSTETI
jgi:hypothetical protein